MNNSFFNLQSSSGAGELRRSAAVLVCVVALANSAPGQGILAPPSTTFGAPAAVQPFQAGQTGMGVFGTPSQSVAGILSAPLGLAESAFVSLHPRLRYSLSYGSGIPAAPGADFNTWVQEISPGILLNLGEHWTLDYSPTLRLYSSKHFQNTTDESVGLDGKTSYDEWGFQFSQGFHDTTQPTVETGGLVSEQSYTTLLSASRSIGVHSAITATASQSFRFADQLDSVKEWSGSLYYDNHWVPWLTAGMGVVGGYDLELFGSDMTFEQLQGRINWQPGEKLTLSANAGVEDRQFLGSTSRSLVNPIFGVSASYLPFPNTSIQLAVSRSVTPSFYQNQVIVNTSTSLSAHQRLFGKLTADVGIGYTTTPFEGFVVTTNPFSLTPGGGPISSGVLINRTDYSRYFRVSLGMPIRNKGSMSIFYSATDNTSGLATFAYTSRQVGLEMAYRY